MQQTLHYTLVTLCWAPLNTDYAQGSWLNVTFSQLVALKNQDRKKSTEEMKVIGICGLRCVPEQFWNGLCFDWVTIGINCNYWIQVAFHVGLSIKLFRVTACAQRASIWYFKVDFWVFLWHHSLICNFDIINDLALTVWDPLYELYLCRVATVSCQGQEQVQFVIVTELYKTSWGKQSKSLISKNIYVYIEKHHTNTPLGSIKKILPKNNYLGGKFPNPTVLDSDTSSSMETHLGHIWKIKWDPQIPLTK